MSIRKILLATALVATSAGFAIAQNTTTPADQTRPGLQGTDSSKQKDTLPGNQKAGTTGTMTPSGATTGAGVNPAKETMDKNVSPASPKAGEQQNK